MALPVLLAGSVLIALILGGEEQPRQPCEPARLLILRACGLGRTRLVRLARATPLIGVARC